MTDERVHVCVIGAGPVGRTLASAWGHAGHRVTVAVRNPRASTLDGLEPFIDVRPLSDLPDADATLLAIPGPALSDLLARHGAALDGRLIIDATNDITGRSLHQLPLLAERLPASPVFRAFNTLGWKGFRPEIAGEQPDLFYSGPDIPRRHLVERLIGGVGMRPIYVGEGVDAADVLDAASRVWWVLAYRRNIDEGLALRLLEDTGETGASDAPPEGHRGPSGSIAVIGRGALGRTLGAAFARAGYAVTFGVRHPDETGPQTRPPNDGRPVTIAKAVTGAQIVVLAVPGSAVEVIASTYASDLAGRLVIDATNGSSNGPGVSGHRFLAPLAGVRYARAFSTLGVDILNGPPFGGFVPDMFYSCDEADRQLLADLIRSVRLRPVWLGAKRHDVVDDVRTLLQAVPQGGRRRVALRVLTDVPDRLEASVAHDV